MSTQTSTVFTVPLFTIVKKWKKPRCASTDEWADEILPAMEYYLDACRWTLKTLF